MTIDPHSGAHAPALTPSNAGHAGDVDAGVWLLSGGVESTALMFDWAQRAKRAPSTTRAVAPDPNRETGPAQPRSRIVHVDYGQRNAAREWAAVQALHAWLPGTARPELIRVDLSALRQVLQSANGWTAHVPAPERNLLLIALARNLAAVRGLRHIVLGLTLDDQHHGVGGNALWWDTINTALNAHGDGQQSPGASSKRPRAVGKAGHEPDAITLMTPFRHQTKAEVIAARADAPWTLSWSCLLDRERPCGACPQCEARTTAFRHAGVVDPLSTIEPAPRAADRPVTPAIG